MTYFASEASGLFFYRAIAVFKECLSVCSRYRDETFFEILFTKRNFTRRALKYITNCLNTEFLFRDWIK